MERSVAQEYERAHAHLDKIEEAWGDLSVSGLEARHVLEAERPPTQPRPAQPITSCGRCHRCCHGPSRGAGARTIHARAIRKLKIGEGYAPWNWEEIDLFQY